MSICITIQSAEVPSGFTDYLRKFMSRYYQAVEIRQGDRDDIVLGNDATQADETTAWMLLDSAGADYSAKLQGELNPTWSCI